MSRDCPADLPERGALFLAIIRSGLVDRDVVYLFSEDLEAHALAAGLQPEALRRHARRALDLSREEEELGGLVARSPAVREEYRRWILSAGRVRRSRLTTTLRALMRRAPGGLNGRPGHSLS